MKVTLVYDSVYGNTEQIAKAMAEALVPIAEVALLRPNEASPELMRDADLTIVGSPTRGFRPTEAIQGLLKELPSQGLRDVKVAVFDTRIAESDVGRGTRMILKLGGYAGGRIAEALKKKGANVVAQPEGFIVKDREGPLREGELERAASWATGVAQSLRLGVGRP